MDEHKNLLEDVLHLEVNTILSDGIQGKGMPGPRHALIDLARAYYVKIEALDVELAGQAPADIKDEQGRMKGSRAAFAWLSKTAAGLMKRADLGPAQRAVLLRVRSQSAIVEEMFKALGARMSDPVLAQNDLTRTQLNTATAAVPPLPLTPKERGAIRKMWELGTDNVVMQTVISIDGDVLNRIERGYASEQHQLLHRLHGEAVETSISTWRFLIQTAVGVVENLLGMLNRAGKDEAA